MLKTVAATLRLLEELPIEYERIIEEDGTIIVFVSPTRYPTPQALEDLVKLCQAENIPDEVCFVPALLDFCLPAPDAFIQDKIVQDFIISVRAVKSSVNEKVTRLGVFVGNEFWAIAHWHNGQVHLQIALGTSMPLENKSQTACQIAREVGRFDLLVYGNAVELDPEIPESCHPLTIKNTMGVAILLQVAPQLLTEVLELALALQQVSLGSEEPAGLVISESVDPAQPDKVDRCILYRRGTFFAGLHLSPTDPVEERVSDETPEEETDDRSWDV